MITKEEFISKVETAGMRYIMSANTVVIESSKTLVFSFENNNLTSFISGYEMRRLFNVRSVSIEKNIISIVDGSTKYDISTV